MSTRTLTFPVGTLTVEKGDYTASLEIEEVIIPEGVTKIEDEAFIFCENLKKVVLPKSFKKRSSPPWITS